MKKIIYFLIFISSITLANAATTIDAIYSWAWSDAIGWIDLYSANGTQNEVVVTSSKIQGSAEIKKSDGSLRGARVDYISFDCMTSPTGNLCGGAGGNWFVSNDSAGNLAGWAWSDSIGWVSFCGKPDPDGAGPLTGGSILSGATWVCPTSPSYQVQIRDIDPSSSVVVLGFVGYAWSDSVGWIDFSCLNTSTCGTVPNDKIKVVTSSWSSATAPSTFDGSLTSKTYDTCVSGRASCSSGVNYNYILWKGLLNGDSNVVKFQLATSNCVNGGTTTAECNNTGTNYWGNARTSGDGAFAGPDGTSATYYPAAATSNPDEPVRIVGSNHKNKRYYRYQVFLDSADGSTSPIIRDIIVNWSF